MTTKKLTGSTTRRASATAAAVLTLGILSGCGDTQGEDLDRTLPEDVEALSEDLGTLGDRVTELEDRLAELEPGLPEDVPAGEGVAVFADPTAYVGEEVTVMAEVSELYDTTAAGRAFRLAADVGEQVAVISTDPPEELLANDVVRVTGTVHMVDEQAFEDNFGIAADELFNAPVNFFVDADGEAAIAADTVELVPGG